MDQDTGGRGVRGAELHTVITSELWEEEFRVLPFRGTFPPAEVYPDEDARVRFVLCELERCGFRRLQDARMDEFERARDSIHGSFHVRWSSISRPMERLLYAFAGALRPRLTAVVGCAAGVSLGFLAASLNHNIHPPIVPRPEIIGIDVDESVVEIARQNLHALNLASVDVKIVSGDAHHVLQTLTDLDLVVLDADGRQQGPLEHRGKRIYESLLDAMLPQLSPEATLIAHDVRWASLNGDVAAYLARVRDPAVFSRSVEIRFDIQGIEVSQR